MLIETLSVWFLRHCSETQVIWETLNPKVCTYQVQVAYLSRRIMYNVDQGRTLIVYDTTLANYGLRRECKHIISFRLVICTLAILHKVELVPRSRQLFLDSKPRHTKLLASTVWTRSMLYNLDLYEIYLRLLLDLNSTKNGLV